MARMTPVHFLRTAPEAADALARSNATSSAGVRLMVEKASELKTSRVAMVRGCLCACASAPPPTAAESVPAGGGGRGGPRRAPGGGGQEGKTAGRGPAGPVSG